MLIMKIKLLWVILMRWLATQSEVASFMTDFSLSSLFHDPTCFKSGDGRCIDLILSNKSRSFQESNSFETSISDHDHLVYTMFRSKYTKAPPQTFPYRSFRKLSTYDFRKDLVEALSKTVPGDFQFLSGAIEQVLDVHAPEKKRVVRGNQNPYITKALRMAIMRRSFLKNKANKTGDANFINLYKRQRNIVVNMNREAKKSYFHSLGTSKDFRKYSKPYFSNKSLMRESTVLHDDDKNVITDEISIASLLNNYFVNIANDLNITPWKSYNLETNQSALNDMDQVIEGISGPSQY